MANSYEQYAVRDRAPDAKKAVLLVIGMQEHFRGNATPILPAIQTTIDLARGAQIPVIYTRHSHKGPLDNGMLHEWWGGDLIKAGSPDAELMPEVHKLQVIVIFFDNLTVRLLRCAYWNRANLEQTNPHLYSSACFVKEKAEGLHRRRSLAQFCLL